MTSPVCSCQHKSARHRADGYNCGLKRFYDMYCLDCNCIYYGLSEPELPEETLKPECWTQEEIDQARIEADRIAEELNWK